MKLWFLVGVRVRDGGFLVFRSFEIEGDDGSFLMWGWTLVAKVWGEREGKLFFLCLRDEFEIEIFSFFYI